MAGVGRCVQVWAGGWCTLRHGGCARPLFTCQSVAGDLLKPLGLQGLVNADTHFFYWLLGMKAAYMQTTLLLHKLTQDHCNALTYPATTVGSCWNRAKK